MNRKLTPKAYAYRFDFVPIRSHAYFPERLYWDSLENSLELRDLIQNKLIFHLFFSRQESSTVAEVEIIYHEVSYYDILLLEEAIYVNNTFGDLQVNGVEIDSKSGKCTLTVSNIKNVHISL